MKSIFIEAAAMPPPPAPPADYIGQLTAALIERGKVCAPLERPFSRPAPAELARLREAAAIQHGKVAALFWPDGKGGETLQAELAAHEAVLRDAKQGVADAEQERAQLMLDSAADSKIEAIELTIARARRAVERIAASNLRAKLEAERKARSAEAWRRFYPGYADLQRKFVATMRSALDLQKQLQYLTGFAGSEITGVDDFLAFPAEYVIHREPVDAYAERIALMIAVGVARGPAKEP